MGRDKREPGLTKRDKGEYVRQNVIAVNKWGID